jgi:hypothetical protein
MKKIFLLVAIVIHSAAVVAQLVESKIVRVGEELAPAISPTGYYRFAEFTNGIVKKKNGSISKTRLNLHICNGEMQFIDAKGDTLAIAQPELVDNIHIGENTQFVFADKGYYELVGESPAGKLGKRITVQIANDKKTGYGQSDPTGSHNQVGDVMFDWRTVTLSYDVEVRKTTSYYWVDNNNKAIPVNKKNTSKLVEKQKQARLQAFMNENNTNFNNEEDLRKLLAFAATL